MRRDAEANRAKLVLAGRRMMQEEGGTVPVERICDEAGVTRGTFYRNFADRASLYEAVLSHELGTVARTLEGEPDGSLAFIRLLSKMMMVYDKFLAALPGMDDYPEHDGNEARIVTVIEPALQRAKEVGEVAPHVSGADVLLACRMIAANWRHDRQPSREAAMERRMALMMTGLGVFRGS